MNTEEKLERVADNLDRLTIVVDTLAATATARNNGLDALLKIVETNSQQIAATDRQR